MYVMLLWVSLLMVVGVNVKVGDNDSQTAAES